jgi:hypothetical protein
MNRIYNLFIASQARALDIFLLRDAMGRDDLINLRLDENFVL